jgi:hypothetical protein
VIKAGQVPHAMKNLARASALTMVFVMTGYAYVNQALLENFVQWLLVKTTVTVEEYA